MFEIKRALPGDAAALAEIGRVTFVETFAKDNSKENMDEYVASTFGKDKQLAEINDPKRRIEIAWMNNSAAGFLHLVQGNTDPSVVGAKPVELLKLYVGSAWHGKGVGPALMERCLQIARDEDFKTLWLGVWERNLRAQAFYKKFGFTVVGKHIFRLGSDDQTDLIMARTI